MFIISEGEEQQEEVDLILSPSPWIFFFSLFFSSVFSLAKQHLFYFIYLFSILDWRFCVGAKSVEERGRQWLLAGSNGERENAIQTWKSFVFVWRVNVEIQESRGSVWLSRYSFPCLVWNCFLSYPPSFEWAFFSCPVFGIARPIHLFLKK